MGGWRPRAPFPRRRPHPQACVGAAVDDRAAVSPFALAVWGAGILVGLVLALAGFLYASDYAVEATVQDKRCSLAGSEIDVRTKAFGIDHTVRDVPLGSCHLVQPGNFATYHVRSGRTTLYASEGGDCLYDSARGVAC